MIVRDSSSSTEHVVNVPRIRLGARSSRCDRERLLKESFRFLLEREPKESMMRKFEISVIERYLPEYPGEMRSRMA